MSVFSRGRVGLCGPTFTAALAVPVFALTNTAVAQTTDAQDAGTPQSSQGAAPTTDLEEVVVTAQKRSESLLSTAAPVTALSATDLARRADVKLSDYAASVPGLNLISSGGQTAVILRGVTTGYGAATSATVGTYIDDAPYGSATANALGAVMALDLDPATLQRVEVLRGPQGTLYGADALGGLIKYVTAPPSLTEYRGRVEVDGSSIDGGGLGGGVRAMLDGPLVKDQLGIALSAYDRRDPGWIDDPYLNTKNVNSARVYGGRVAISWRPTDQLSVDLSVISQNSFNDGTAAADLNSDLTPIYGKYAQVRHEKELWDDRDTHYSLRANYDFGWAALTSISTYQTQSALWTYDESLQRGPALQADTGIPNLGVFEHVVLHHHKDTQEFRLSSPDGARFEWLGGVFYTHEWGVKDENFTPISTLTNLPVTLSQPVFHDVLNDSYTEYAGYADVTYHLTSRFKVLAGLRAASNSETAVTPFSGILFGPTPVVDRGSSSDRSVTYLVSPSYNFDDHNMIYIRVASGYRPGGPTGVAPALLANGAPETYKPDSLTNYELGYKASFPELRMTLDVSAFDIEWKNIQILTQINGFNVTGNGAAARSAGFEFAWTWKPIPGLALSANGAYTDAYMTAPDPADAVKSGDELPYVPKLSANLAADYDFPITNDISGFVGGNFQYVGSRVRDFVSGVPATYVRPVAPAYNAADLRAGVIRGGLSVEAYVKNVGDSYGLNRIKGEVTPLYKAPLAVTTIQPRTFGLSIGYKF